MAVEAPPMMPIILAGKAEPVAEKAINDMKPDLEVVHFTFINDARREIPLLTRGELPSPRNPHGSDNWSVRPKAIVYAAVYRPKDIELYKKLTLEAAGEGFNDFIPWLVVSPDIPNPPVGPELVRVLTARSKDLLKKLDEEGTLVPGEFKIHYF